MFQLEAGQIKLQSRLEEEEQAKAALMGRIQRLTKLILVSTKTSIQSNIPEKPSHWRRHSFGEDEVLGGSLTSLLYNDCVIVVSDNSLLFSMHDFE